MGLSLVNISQVMVNPFAPLFVERTRFEASRAVSRSILDYKQAKMPVKFGHARNAKSRNTAVSTFTFRLSLPFFFCISFFFSFAAKDHFTVCGLGTLTFE